MLIGCSGRYGYCCYASGGSSSPAETPSLLAVSLQMLWSSVKSGAAAAGGEGRERLPTQQFRQHVFFLTAFKRITGFIRRQQSQL